METPLSSRRVTRSQATIIDNNNYTIPLYRKMEDSEKGLSKSRNQNQQRDRALIDITNDSPIVGLAAGNMETPLSSMGKKNNWAKSTPGFGEALLRGQVKTLLQKVEEEVELSKLDNTRPVLQLKGLVNSPMGLLAPTPANTPQISNISGDGSVKDSGLATITSFPEIQYQSMVPETIDLKKEEGLESEKDMITRSLFSDFFDKSESTDSSECSSEVTFQATIGQRNKQSADDDEESIWSIQVNASSTHDEDEEEVIENEEEYEEEYYYYEDEEENDDGGLVDTLCEGISNMRLSGTKILKFEGKHTRFVYNSDDEDMIKGEEECDNSGFSPSVLKLKGLPTPKGKHLRFALADEDTEK